MSTESEDERIARWERGERQAAALHRRRMRWWKHAREYLSMRRLVVGGLVVWREPGPDTDYRLAVDPALPDHPPWSSPQNWWPKHRWARQG